MTDVLKTTRTIYQYWTQHRLATSPPFQSEKVIWSDEGETNRPVKIIGNDF